MPKINNKEKRRILEHLQSGGKTFDEAKQMYEKMSQKERARRAALSRK